MKRIVSTIAGNYMCRSNLKPSVIFRTLKLTSHHFSSGEKVRSNQTEEEDNYNQPIKYSTSEAHNHSSFDTFFHSKSSAPWYQSLVIGGSTVAFLLYFCFLREENDWDEELDKSIYDRVPGLKEKDLKGRIQLAHKMGLDATDLNKELGHIKTVGK